MHLDVGCGNRPRGDVNLDLTKTPTWSRYQGRNIGIHHRHIANFLLGDAEHLPFRAKTFSRITSFSTLENVPSPIQAIREMLRVAKQHATIYIYVPHRLGQGSRKHKSVFTLRWFLNVLKRLHIYDYRVTVYYRKYPHEFLPLIRIPKAFDVTFHLSQNLRDNAQ